MKADEATDRLSEWLSDPGAMDTLNLRAAHPGKPEGYRRWRRMGPLAELVYESRISSL